MSETKEEPIADQISYHLTDALFRSKEATGIVMSMAMADGSSWSYRAGNLVTRDGLVRALQRLTDADWHSGEQSHPEDEK